MHRPAVPSVLALRARPCCPWHPERRQREGSARQEGSGGAPGHLQRLLGSGRVTSHASVAKVTTWVMMPAPHWEAQVVSVPALGRSDPYRPRFSEL